MTKDEKYDYAKFLVVSHLTDGVEFLSVHEQWVDYRDGSTGDPEDLDEDDAIEVHDMANAMMFSLAKALVGDERPSGLVRA